MTAVAAARPSESAAFLAILRRDLYVIWRDPAVFLGQVILQPLFRPAADGIVKDEGLPHPALEWLTRSGPR